MFQKKSKNKMNTNNLPEAKLIPMAKDIYIYIHPYNEVEAEAEAEPEDVDESELLLLLRFLGFTIIAFMLVTAFFYAIFYFFAKFSK